MTTATRTAAASAAASTAAPADVVMVAHDLARDYEVVPFQATDAPADLAGRGRGIAIAVTTGEAGLDAAAVTVETAPDSGYRLRNEVEMNIDPNAPAFAQAILREVVDTYPEGSATVRAWVSLTFNASLRTGSKKRTPEDVARDLASRIPGLSARLQSTGAGIARPMSAQELCEVVRIAYDPPAALIIDEAHAAGSPVSLTWGEVGPTATQASWDDYRHDSAFSASWTMTGAPRGSVNAGGTR